MLFKNSYFIFIFSISSNLCLYLDYNFHIHFVHCVSYKSRNIFKLMSNCLTSKWSIQLNCIQMYIFQICKMSEFFSPRLNSLHSVLTQNKRIKNVKNFIQVSFQIPKGLSSSWSYGSWIYKYLCNQCLSPL